MVHAFKLVCSIHLVHVHKHYQERITTTSYLVHMKGAMCSLPSHVTAKSKFENEFA